MSRNRVTRKMSRGVLAAVAAATAATLTLSACGTSSSATPSGPGDAPADLVQAAQKEKTVTLYTADPQNVAQAVADAFQQKYGIEVRFVRLPSSQLEQRYASEAQTGKINADLIFDAGVEVFGGQTAIPKGWGEPIEQANLPALAAFPKEWVKNGTAISEIQPWVIAYNTDKIKADAVPQTFQDVVKVAGQGQVILPDPRAADAYVQFWELMDTSYGDAFLQQYKNTSRVYASGAPASAALAAGDEAVMAPTTAAAVNDVVQTGAPVKVVTPQLTSGAELGVMLTTESKAQHPNAAKLLANYLISPEGSAVIAKAGGSVSVYDKSHLPAQYTSPKPLQNKAKVLSLLGLS
ncbi:MAG TPA: extracellular solute-binding protein [Amycolatopsis sp.]|nr:extracellular solute-binding protein [Amycolatopsis sp.]